MISKRLKAVASLVDTKSIIDVGCDHALLDIYLTKQNISCRATDISSNCIKLAKENISKANLDNKIELYVTDGLKGIKIYDTDTIVICGMGTNQILNILKDFNYDNPLILLSNNDIYSLRKEIIKLGYFIDKELYILDGKYRYVIIRFKKGHKKYKYKDYILGTIKDNEYLNYLYQKTYNNYLKIPKKYILRKLKEKRILNIIKKQINYQDN